MKQHTLRDWKLAEFSANTREYEIQVNGKYLGTIYLPLLKEEERTAIAKLIAAAPEQNSALREIAALCVEHEQDHPVLKWVRFIAQTAIAKATE